ncbi:MAG: VPGUxxT family thioredoxin-like (seleno)protein, type 2 [Planctomycetota bacterium]
MNLSSKPIGMLAGGLLLTCILASDTVATDTNPIEIGTVKWGRDFDDAMKRSEQSDKPMLVLFQEVPGCSGCKAFGKEVLSHPLLVEAIEDEFVPVVVYNNQGEEDAKLLKRFNEPAWNYQVLRFLDSSGKDVIPRKAGVHSISGVASRMMEALRASDRDVPLYLESVAAVHDSKKQDLAAFAMHCFWTGEYQLGKIDGVIATEAGWHDGREVTLVRFDRDKVSIDALSQEAAKVRCADRVYTLSGQSVAGLPSGKLDKDYRTASGSDQKRQLSRFPAAQRIPGINAMQLTKLNAFVPSNARQGLRWLSPRQRQALASDQQK